jgi:hypothetical protein
VRSNNIFRIIFLASIIAAMGLHLFFRTSRIEDVSLLATLKIQIPLDFYPFIILLVHSVVVTTSHLLKGQNRLAFWGYAFFASFFTYSYLGEKVPWLNLYAFIPGLIYLALYFEDTGVIDWLCDYKVPIVEWPLKTILLAFIFLFTARISIMTNFSRAGKETEFISQVHTLDSFENLAMKIKNEIENPIRGFSPQVMALKEPVWPATWYYFGMPEYTFDTNQQDVVKVDYIFASQGEIEVKAKVAQTHRMTTIPFRGWWVPDYALMNWKNYFIYALAHNPWSPPGVLTLDYFSKKSAGN